MDNELPVQTKSIIEILRDQVVFLLDVLSRPVVQQQILVFIFIVVLSWLFVEGVQRRFGKRERVQEFLSAGSVPRNQLWSALVFYVLTPIIALAFLNLTSWVFALQRQPNGLLAALTNIIWIWLIYRALLGILYFRFGEAARQYQKWIVTPLFIFLVALQLMSFLPGFIALMDATIAFGAFSFTLRNLFLALIVLYLFIVIGWIIKILMVNSLPSRLNVEYGTVESIGTLTRYALNSLGIIIGLGVLGLDFASLAIIAGGLSVGVGVGLAKILSNLVSGLIILFERSLRPGDVVELDDRIGQIENISLRATTVNTPLNEKYIYPNNYFITQKVVNLTKSDRLVQESVPFSVRYGSDPEFVQHIAQETCLRHPSVSADPAPVLIFRGYQAGSLHFDSRVNLKRADFSGTVKSDLYFMLWEAFKEHKIEVSG